MSAEASVEKENFIESLIRNIEGDRDVLYSLQDLGADLAKPTTVYFYLYFQTQDAADRFAAFAGAGFLEATVSREADDVNWRCVVTGQIIPHEDEIHAHSVRLLALAHLYHGEYDGWEADVTK